MSAVIASMEVTATATSRRTRGRLLVRTVKRRLAKRALHFITAILAHDSKDDVAGALKGYNPFRVSGATGSPDFKAFQKVQKRLTDALAAKE